MTDSKAATTLSIDQTEWRVLFAENVRRMQEFVGQSQTLSADHLTALLGHLDRAKVLAVAWHRSTVPAQANEEPKVPEASLSNSEAPRKKRGWPAGKPRKRLNPAQVVQ